MYRISLKKNRRGKIALVVLPTGIPCLNDHQLYFLFPVTSLTNQGIMLPVAITAIALFFAVLVVSIYCYRVKKLHIRYELTKFSMRKMSKAPIDEFLFHVFISYSSADTEWVEDHLMSRLENDNHRFKVCVHERDFKVGKSIAENIILSLEQSATCLLILTEQFIRSYWCNFEAHAANQIFQERNRFDNLVK